MKTSGKPEDDLRMVLESPVDQRMNEEGQES